MSTPSHSTGAGESPSHEAPAPEQLTRTTSHKSIPIDSMDPEGTAELTRRLTQHSVASRQAQHPKTIEEGDGELPATFDPFDEAGKFDLEKFLREMLGRKSEKGNETRTMGIAFHDLTVTGYGTGVGLSENLGSMMMGPVNALRNISALRNPPVKTILDKFEGCIRPGEMLLVLGRPGSGCTTLLKTLASYRDGFRSIEGDISWQGWSHKEINGQLRGEVVYAPEDDFHFATLNVKQTLEFATATRAPQAQHRVTLGDKQSREEYVAMSREALATILGLRHTYDTKVGDAAIRGVSGGEKKRVSIAEILATRAKIALYDNSTRGLDSSTAVEFVRALRIATDIASLSLACSIYQAGESISRMFDKVVVLAEGKMVYFGTVENAANYFYELGFERHFKQTTADYLVSVTDEHARLIREGYEDRAPRTSEELAAAFRNSEAGRRNHEEVVAYAKELKEAHTAEAAKHYLEVQRQEKAKHTRSTSPYLLSWPQQIRLALIRRLQIMRGDIATQIVMMCAATFQALIIGSTFYNMALNTGGFFSRGGVLFFAMLFNAFTAMSEIPGCYGQRPIVIRQARFAMLHASADALANSIIDIPLRMITGAPFSIIIYFLTGLYYSADNFFIFFGTVNLVTYAMVTFFRAAAAAFRSQAVATMIAGLTIIDVALYAGYIIPRPSMVVWWKWLSYCNPIAFGFEILITNEFRKLNVACAQVVPAGPGFENVATANQVCLVPGGGPGQLTISGSDYAAANFGYYFSNSGRNAGIIIGFWIFFVICYAVASEYQTDPAAAGGKMIFKRDTAPKAITEAAKAHGEDAEKQIAATSDNPAAVDVEEETAEAEEAVKGLQVSSDVFAWSHVNYDVLIKKDARRLLSDVSGYVAPGKLTALMGESGAGKTTLLNVLANRAGTGVVEGNFSVAGRPLPRSFQADTGYCQQQDTHLSTTTVREALQFSALLRQPAEVSKEEKLAYVETVLKMLEMESFAEAIVGDVGEGLNVEQRKRLTIAVELAAKPKLLLFLDEPTSGLDAQAAWSIVRFLRKLADAGQAILCTIHQPSGELFAQYDRLILLKKGGKVVYNGNLGKNCSELLPYFAKQCGRECSEDENPAEYMLDVIGAGATATTKFDWHQLYLESEMHAKLLTELDKYENMNKGLQISAEDAERGNREYAAPLAVQMDLVLRRAFKHYWRSPTYLSAKLGLNVIAGLFIGSSFWNQGSLLSTASLQNRLFSIFMSLVLSTSLAQQAQPIFIDSRALYETRERPSKLYAWPIVVLTGIVVEIPWNFLGTTIFWAPWYWMISFSKESSRAFYMWLALMVFSVYWSTFAIAMAAMAPNAMLASVLFSVFFSFVIVFCGVVQPPSQMPGFWRNFTFPLSPFTYLVEGMLGNTLGGSEIRCDQKELNVLNPPAGQSCEAFLRPYYNAGASGYFVEQPGGGCGVCGYNAGDQYLATLSSENITISASHKWRNIGIVCAYVLFNVALAFGTFWLFRIRASNGKATRRLKAAKSGAATPAARHGAATPAAGAATPAAGHQTPRGPPPA